MNFTRFIEARLKHDRAQKHISELKSIWNSFIQTDFAEVRVEPHPEGGELIRVVSRKSIPGEFQLVLGDAIHALRSSLDYVASEITGRGDTRITFPMGETREELSSAFSTVPGDPCPKCSRGGKRGRYAAIEEAIPGFGKFIVDEIKPYKGPDGYIWILNKLDVRDKHRLLIAAYDIQTVHGINAIDNGNNSYFSMTGAVDSRGAVNLVHSVQGGFKIKNYGKASAEVFLNEVGVINRQPLFPALLNMSQAVSETIDAVERFLPPK